MNVSTRQLQAFVAVARLGSFTRAAEEVFVTQAGLSLMMKDLEAQVGSRLFDRTTRSVQLTSAGAALLPVVRRMLDDWESAVANIGRLSGEAERSLSIAATPLIAASVLPRSLRIFGQRRPQARVRLQDADRSHILQLVHSGEVDLGMGAFFKPVAGIERQRLASFAMLFVTPAGAAVPLPAGSAAAARLPWSALGGAKLIVLPPDNPIQKLVDEQMRRCAVTCEHVNVLNNLQSVLAMVEAGHGSAILPAFVTPACERLAVDTRPLGAPGVSVDFYVVRKKGREQNDLARDFIDALRRDFGSMRAR